MFQRPHRSDSAPTYVCVCVCVGVCVHECVCVCACVFKCLRCGPTQEVLDRSTTPLNELWKTMTPPPPLHRCVTVKNTELPWCVCVCVCGGGSTTHWVLRHRLASLARDWLQAALCRRREDVSCVWWSCSPELVVVFIPFHLVLRTWSRATTEPLGWIPLADVDSFQNLGGSFTNRTTWTPNGTGSQQQLDPTGASPAHRRSRPQGETHSDLWPRQAVITRHGAHFRPRPLWAITVMKPLDEAPPLAWLDWDTPEREREIEEEGEKRRGRREEIGGWSEEGGERMKERRER